MEEEKRKIEEMLRSLKCLGDEPPSSFYDIFSIKGWLPIIVLLAGIVSFLKCSYQATSNKKGLPCILPIQDVPIGWLLRSKAQFSQHFGHLVLGIYIIFVEYVWFVGICLLGRSASISLDFLGFVQGGATAPERAARGGGWLNESRFSSEPAKIVANRRNSPKNGKRERRMGELGRKPQGKLGASRST